MTNRDLCMREIDSLINEASHCDAQAHEQDNSAEHHWTREVAIACVIFQRAKHDKDVRLHLTEDLKDAPAGRSDEHRLLNMIGQPSNKVAKDGRKATRHADMVLALEWLNGSPRSKCPKWSEDVSVDDVISFIRSEDTLTGSMDGVEKIAKLQADYLTELGRKEAGAEKQQVRNAKEIILKDRARGFGIDTDAEGWRARLAGCEKAEINKEKASQRAERIRQEIENLIASCLPADSLKRGRFYICGNDGKLAIIPDDKIASMLVVD